MIKSKTPLNIVFGIGTEVLYGLCIMLAELLVCLLLTFKR